jgi:hypothetical protein
VKIGVMLPTFESSVLPAIEFAAEAESLGLDGVFGYDHLWPMGHPGLPSISVFPLLGAVATTTKSISFGTLVARVGLEPDDVMVSEFETLTALAPQRAIAGLGTGDRKSALEGLAYGVPMTTPDERRASIVSVAMTLKSSGIEVWIGGGAALTNQLALDLGCTLNLWAAPVERVALLAQAGEVTWGGQLPRSSPVAASKLAQLAEAGASWAVLSWQGDLPALIEVVQLAGVRSA